MLSHLPLLSRSRWQSWCYRWLKLEKSLETLYFVAAKIVAGANEWIHSIPITRNTQRSLDLGSKTLRNPKITTSKTKTKDSRLHSSGSKEGIHRNTQQGNKRQPMNSSLFPEYNMKNEQASRECIIMVVSMYNVTRHIFFQQTPQNHKSNQNKQKKNKQQNQIVPNSHLTTSHKIPIH